MRSSRNYQSVASFVFALFVFTSIMLRSSAFVVKVASSIATQRASPILNKSSFQGSRLFLSSLSGEDTVVSRCTEKITSALKPQKIVVSSTNDDPNGSHVRRFLQPCLLIMRYSLNTVCDTDSYHLHLDRIRREICSSTSTFGVQSDMGGAKWFVLTNENHRIVV